MIGKINLSGHAPKGSSVQVYDEAGDIVATCQVAATGQWSISDAELSVGNHEIRAVAKLASGREASSDTIEVTVAPSPERPRHYVRDGSGRLTPVENYEDTIDANDDGMSLDDQLELESLRNEQRARAAALYDQADRLYAELASAVADGFDADFETLKNVLEVVNRSARQFYDDADSLAAIRQAAEFNRLSFAASCDAMRRKF